MDSRICRCKFENEGRFFALITPDGRLKVWDCTNGKLKHDITPDSHLGGSGLTCISWRTSSKIRSKRRKRKSLDASLLEQTCEIGLGTVVGGIFIFDVLNGEIKQHLKDGHDNKVNDIKWNRTTDLLYSCSDDRYITEWTVDAPEKKSKWKGDKTSVHSIQVSPKGDCLLSAGRDIRLWDLEKKEILQKFTGHGTSVSHLLFTPFKSEGMSNGCKTNGYYFLSGAEQDRFLNAWKVDLELKDKSSIVSYSISDEPVSLALSHHPDKEKPLHLIVVSRDGQLHLFEQSLNGHVKKPVNPKSTVQLATPGRKGTSPEPVSIISAHFVESSEPSILIAYGTAIKPQFETLKYESLERDVCLVRDYRPGLLLREENNNQQSLNTNKAVVKNDLLTTLSTENMALARPSCGESGSSTQLARKSSGNKTQELSMEDRLKTMNLTPSSSAQPKMERQSIPKAGSLTQMLIQALNSQDKKLLDDVFIVSSKPKIIQSTIRRLPVNYVIPFVTELVHRIQASPSRGSHLVPWIKTILTIHMSYLMSVPNLVESLGGLYQLFESRVGVYSRLCKLQGRLDLMLAQVSAQTEVVEEEQLTEPMMVYKEDESSEVSDLEELDASEESAESLKDDASDDDRETPSDEEKAASSEDDDNESKEQSDGDVEMRE
ncbi:WD repeat-containing protein 43-like [Dendronephthya gigantea]|uniref:WD repeat-containing protein 43-like n=1 Tax=Dendronephthya gigantea TaxID=151771 RepID=UPI0010696EA5|nr:WD repeat-containing protein 43-like [Dendronephthya gigantea]